jgi:hypothetical protein
MNTHHNTDAKLPAPVAALINGLNLSDKVGHTIALIAVDDTGWPRVALVSIGEVFSATGTDIRLALHAGSGTTAALTESRRGLLTTVVDGTHYRIRVRTSRIRLDEADPLAYFDGTVVRVDEDRVPYAELTSGITYRLNDPAAVINRWSRQIDRLRSLT